MPVCELPAVRDATHRLARRSRLLEPCAARAGCSRVSDAGVKVCVRKAEGCVRPVQQCVPAPVGGRPGSGNSVSAEGGMSPVSC